MGRVPTMHKEWSAFADSLVTLMEDMKEVGIHPSSLSPDNRPYHTFPAYEASHHAAMALEYAYTGTWRTPIPRILDGLVDTLYNGEVENWRQLVFDLMNNGGGLHEGEFLAGKVERMFDNSTGLSVYNLTNGFELAGDYHIHDSYVLTREDDSEDAIQ